MDNSYFILCKQKCTIKRFHICTWDIENTSSIVEIGIEFKKDDMISTDIHFAFFAPFIKKNDDVVCLASSLLSDNDNCKFIFNDTINNFSEISKDKRNGAVLDFTTRSKLIVLPITKNQTEDNGQIVTLEIHLPSNEEVKTNDDLSFYIRFLIKTSLMTLSRVKKNISHNSYTYDIKLNEKRNLPDNVHQIIRDEYSICQVEQCFCIHVVPNSFNIQFLQENKLKSIRDLEVVSFKKYLSKKVPEINKIKEGQYIIVFNKDKSIETVNSYSFFSIFSKEIIGINQIILAICINIICGLLFTFSSLRITYFSDVFNWKKIPIEYWIVAGILFLVLLFFIKPYRFISWIFRKIKKIK